MRNPTLVARNVSMYYTSFGFYESLPSEYSLSANRDMTYPLLIILHGQGQQGFGGSQLSDVLTWGTPELIRDGLFPRSFSSGGQSFSFITIMPQYWSQSEQPQFVNAVINYCVEHYRVRQNRIYIIGASVGGGMVWNAAGAYSGLAARVAAIVPMAGRSVPNDYFAGTIAEANLPVWAFHNNDDPTVPSQWTRDWLQDINGHDPAPDPLAKMTIFPESGHDCWTAASDPDYRENGKNIYEWMLTYTRGADPLPVRLSSYTAQAVSTAANPRIVIKWTTTFEENNESFIVERSADGLNFQYLASVPATNLAQGSSYQVEDASPLSGTGYYRLAQRDIDGTVTYFDIKSVNLGVTGRLAVWPNPATSSLKVSIDNSYKGELQFRIISSAGAVVSFSNFTKLPGMMQQELSLAMLAKGFYILEITGNGYSSRTAFVKK